ncbi:hypothetical protein ECC02_012732 [Trypanosoma cruzi]|uniref:Mucin TcMUCII n=1 Tax=Trypanosoma cruzi TaxID=5693 RepID=A0A7J6XL10_TRYCR|nr:hypothetical protein ECC02_012732 [Trypanosoma cruzi]
MMTCRLLCALLVLALCCCPSVCVTVTADAGQDDTSRLPKLSQEPGLTADSSHSNAHTNPVPRIADALSPPVKAVKEGKSGVSSSTENGESATEQTDSESVGTKSRGSTENSSKSVVKKTEQIPGLLRPNEEANLPITNTKTTTTTTTNAPTTTTTTTTKTAAPEAPTSTSSNAEAPTTTTTRTPSRLREIDGSLSSSACVCAPLLLAVSALACTAVG